MKFIAISMWIVIIGSALWLLEKVTPENNFEDWWLFISKTFIVAFAGDILIKLVNINFIKESDWRKLIYFGVSFLLGIVLLLLGILYSATSTLGSPYPGFIIAFLGIAYYNYTIVAINSNFKKLNNKA